MITRLNEFRKHLQENELNEGFGTVEEMSEHELEQLKNILKDGAYEDGMFKYEDNIDKDKYCIIKHSGNVFEILRKAGEDADYEDYRDFDSFDELVEFLTQVDEGKKTFAKVHPKKGKMHKVLGIPEDKEIKSVYTSGKKLAADLVAKVGKKKAEGMLAFAANVNKADNIFDKALRALKNVNKNVNEAAKPASQEFVTKINKLADQLGFEVLQTFKSGSGGDENVANVKVLEVKKTSNGRQYEIVGSCFQKWQADALIKAHKQFDASVMKDKNVTFKMDEDHTFFIYDSMIPTLCKNYGVSID